MWPGTRLVLSETSAMTDPDGFLRPVMRCCRLLGLLPLWGPDTQTTAGAKAVWLSVTTIVVYFQCTEMSWDNSRLLLLRVVCYSLSILVQLCSCMLNVFTNQTIRRLVSHIGQIDHELESHLGHRMPRSTWSKCFLGIIAAFVSFRLSCGCWVYLTESVPFVESFRPALHVFPILIIWQWMALVLMCKQRFAGLNRLLARLDTRGDTSDNSSDHVRSIVTNYRALVDTCRAVNDVYCWFILVYIARFFYCAIVICGFYIASFVKQLSWIRQMVLLTNVIEYTVCIVAVIVAVIVAAAETTQEAANLQTQVDHFLANGHPTRALRLHLETFMFELTHNKVKFHVAGFFRLDVPLILTLLATIISYVITCNELYKHGQSI